MMRSFVPRRLQPWLYVFMAVTFQLSGGLYMGTLSHMMGETTLMREDLQMCLYANLAGMAIYFPLLFRMKFRFTNKTLLAAAALTVLACNALVTCTTFLPLLWALCFIEGIGKIQGTFECMSNIQLWMTPKRDMTIFFPLLHIVILTSMNLQDFMSAYFGMLGDWRLMHWFVAGVHCVVLLFLLTCVRHFRFMRPLPLYGIDWTSMALWAALLVQVAYVLNYGDWYAWFNHDAVWYLTQMRRWGQIPEPQSDDWYFDVAKSVYRPDIYRLAAQALIDEGDMQASDFPEFATESGFRAPQGEFIDGKVFDGTKPNSYLEQFPIGLKGDEIP